MMAKTPTSNQIEKKHRKRERENEIGYGWHDHPSRKHFFLTNGVERGSDVIEFDSHEQRTSNTQTVEM